MKTDNYELVNSKIIAALEKGTAPWQKPWFCTPLPERHNGIPYTGCNVFILWITAEEKGYISSRWMTFNQAKKLGGMVRKGEKATLVFFTKTLHKTETNAKGEEKDRSIYLLRAFPVFNVEQIDGLAEKYYAKPVIMTPGSPEMMQRQEAAEVYFKKVGAVVMHTGSRAFYSPDMDIIVLPEFKAFKDAPSYYSTKAHEHIHWTGGEKRLDRKLRNRFGDDAYAAEELIAELGSAYLCAYLGIPTIERDDHAAYLAHWIKVMKADNRAIFTAASAASKAVAFLHGLAGVTPVEAEEETDEAGEATAQMEAA